MPKSFPTEYVFDTATSDKGMTKKDRALFHTYNPNGAVESLPDHWDFMSDDGKTFWAGLSYMYWKGDNWHARKLREIAVGDRKTFTTQDVAYHAMKCREMAKEAVEEIAKKRAAEEAKKRAAE